MSDQRRKEKNREKEKGEKGAPGQMPQVVDALRHVGPTLEQDERYLAVERNELPENIIAERGLVEATPHPDPYEREAEAMGAEPLRTRLPGDTSSDPHTDVGPDSAATLDTDRKRNRGEAA